MLRRKTAQQKHPGSSRSLNLVLSCGNWLVGALDSLSKKPEIVLNGFRKADALKSDVQ